MRNILIAVLLLFAIQSYGQVESELLPIGSPYQLGRYKGSFTADSNIILPYRDAKKYHNKPGRIWFHRYGDTAVRFFTGVKNVQLLSERDSARIAGWIAAGADGQTLSIHNDTISISNGNSIKLPAYAYSAEIADTSAAIRSDFADAITDSVALRFLKSNVVTSFASPNNTQVATTAATNTLVSNYTRIADTANMLLPYLRTPDTTGNTGKVLTKGASSIYWGALSVVGSLQSSNSSLSISPPTGAVDAILNVSKSNSWLVPQDFTKITIDTLQAHTSAGGAIRTNSGASAISWGAGGGQNITFAGYPITNSGDSVLTTNSSGGLLLYDLKGNYKKISDSTGGTGYVQRSTAQKTADSLAAIIATKGSGTVTAVNAGYAITGGNITASGTHGIDSAAIATRARVQKAVDSLNAIIGTKGSGTVTAVNAGYAITGGNITISGTHGVDTGLVATKALSQKKSDSLGAIIATKGSGTVTSVATGYGLTGGTITNTGTVAADSGALATKGYAGKMRDTAITYTGAAITAERTATATITNKRIEFRTTTASSYTTSVAINADNFDRVVDTAQSGNLLLAAPTGTPSDGQELIYTITAASGTISLTYNSIFVASTNIPVLPTGTAATTYRTIKMKFIYNQRSGKWFIVAKDTW